MAVTVSSLLWKTTSKIKFPMNVQLGLIANGTSIVDFHLLFYGVRKCYVAFMFGFSFVLKYLLHFNASAMNNDVIYFPL